MSDFDLTVKMGLENSFPYVFWSPLSAEGMVTPDCDIYGLAMCLGVSMFKDFNTMVTNYQKECMDIALENKFSDLLPSLLTNKEYQKLLDNAFDKTKNPLQDPKYKVITLTNYLKQEIDKNQNSSSPESKAMLNLYRKIEATKKTLNRSAMSEINGLFLQGMQTKTTDLLVKLNQDISLKELNNTKNDPGMIVNTIENVLNQIDVTSLDSEQLIAAEFKAELTQMPAMWKLVSGQIKQSYQFFDAVIGNIDDPEGHEEEIDALMKENGVLTAAEFAQEVENIQNKLPVAPHA